MKIDKISEIREIINKSKRIIVTTHTNPDGDAIGSSLAMFHYLRQAGKEVHIIVPNKYPEFISWLPGNEEIIIFENERKRSLEILDKAEAVFCLDYNAIKRSGNMQEVLAAAKAVKIMIDHHPDPESNDFDYLYSTTETSSTAELLYVFFSELDASFRASSDIATCLYVGIMTDTGSFSFSCNRPETFSVTASLLETGIDAAFIHRMVYDTFSEDRLRLLGYSLAEKLIVRHDMATAYIALSRDELKRFNFRVGDTEGIVNYALSMKGIVLAILLTEKNGRIRLSFRSKGNFSVNMLAREHFKGGGHKNAAGGDAYDTLENTIAKLEQLLPLYEKSLLREAEATK